MANLANPVAILLAAGKSNRMGKDKLFVDVGGKPLIQRSLRPYRKAERVQDVIIVTTPAAAPRLEPLRGPTIHIVENPDPDSEMISSIRAGLNCSWAQERDFLIAPADVPFIDPAFVDQLVNTFITRGKKIVIPAYKGLGGHPGVFDRSLREDFFLHGDQSGTREILFRYRSDTLRLNVPECDVCFDIDTPEDLAIAMDAGARWACVDERAERKRLGTLGR